MESPTSPCNDLLLPVKKGYGKSWWPVHHLHAVNEAVFAWALVVLNQATILSSVLGSAKWFSVADLTNAFFIVLDNLKLQYWFMFIFNHKNWTCCPHGFYELLTVYSAALQENLADFVSPKGSTFIHHVDNVFICSTSEENCVASANALLKYLASQGQKASLKHSSWSNMCTTYDMRSHKTNNEQNSSSVVNT